MHAHDVLQALVLPGNGITEVGAKALLAALQPGRHHDVHEHLTSLDLSHNPALRNAQVAKDLQKALEDGTCTPDDCDLYKNAFDICVSKFADYMNDDCANIIYASGERADNYLEKSFQIKKTLVGRAVELGRSLPANGQYSAKSPIFFEGDCPQDLGSLLVLPLTTSDEGPMGVLVLGARAANVFGQQIQTMLELIAGQVAIKLDLGRAHETIREMAMVDGMTGLKNHRTFQQAFDTMLERASRRQDDLCMMLMDIDHFKRLNDTYGHPFGDEVLKQVAAVLGSAARKVDLAARYGGEEFALLIEDAELASSRMIAERVRAEVEALRFQHDSMGEVSVTISMGIACYPEHGQTKDELVANADQALYLAKQSGRNRVCDWSELPNGFDENLAEQTQITASG